MTSAQWAIAVMFALSFINRVMSVFDKGKDAGTSLAALVIVMGWFVALVALLHSGGFW